MAMLLALSGGESEEVLVRRRDLRREMTAALDDVGTVQSDLRVLRVKVTASDTVDEGELQQMESLMAAVLAGAEGLRETAARMRRLVGGNV
jgi:hypothetical protein